MALAAILQVSIVFSRKVRGEWAEEVGGWIMIEYVMWDYLVFPLGASAAAMHRPEWVRQALQYWK